jgi:TolB-like protein/lipoprotein NlpI
MQQSEESAVQIRNRHRHIFEKINEKYAGEILQYYGDGTLSIYGSTVDAARCAIEMQNLFLVEPKIPVRIGINLGDVLLSDQDVIGDSVNIASRIESLGLPGSILISEKVAEDLKNQNDFSVVNIGKIHLKNDENPRDIYAIDLPGLTVPKFSDLGGKQQTSSDGKSDRLNNWNWNKIVSNNLFYVIFFLLALLVIGTLVIQKQQEDQNPNQQSIAVLPFRNESSNQDNQYFCNGIMESILNKLSGIHSLLVVPRTSVEKYRDNTPSVTSIGNDLKVDYIVQGSVQRIGDRAVVFASLVNTKTELQLWSQSFDRQLMDIFAVQNEITGKIASELEYILTDADLKIITSSPTRNLQAYEYYLEGKEILFLINSRYLPNEEWKEALNKAQTLFNKAYNHDKQMAEALVGLAEIDFRLSQFSDFLDDNYLEEVDSLVNKALAIKPNLPDALRLKSQYYYQKNQYNLALEYINQALELNPNNIDALYFLQNLALKYKLDYKKSLNTLKKIELRVSSKEDLWRLYYNYGNFYWSINDLEKYRNYVEKMENIDSDKTLGKIFYNMASGNHQEWCGSIEEKLKIENQTKLAMLAECNLHSGNFTVAADNYRKWEALVLNENPDNLYSIIDWHRYGQAEFLRGNEDFGREMMQKQMQTNLKRIELGGRLGNDLFPYYDIAGIYAFLGNPDSSYFYLEKLEENNCWIREGWLYTFIQHDLQFNNLQDKPKFIEFLNRGLDQQRLVKIEINNMLAKLPG